MNRFWSAAQASLLFLDPETAHEASLRALEAGVYPRQAKPEDQRLAQTLFGLSFPNPVGVAAGDVDLPRLAAALEADVAHLGRRGGALGQERADHGSRGKG